MKRWVQIVAGIKSRRGVRREQRVPLASAYDRAFTELENADQYRTYNVYEFYVKKAATPDPDKVNVILSRP